MVKDVWPRQQRRCGCGRAAGGVGAPAGPHESCCMMLQDVFVKNACTTTCKVGDVLHCTATVRCLLRLLVSRCHHDSHTLTRCTGPLTSSPLPFICSFIITMAVSLLVHHHRCRLSARSSSPLPSLGSFFITIAVSLLVHRLEAARLLVCLTTPLSIYRHYFCYTYVRSMPWLASHLLAHLFAAFPLGSHLFQFCKQTDIAFIS